MEKLLGVILCGGQSTRMGSDKGLMKTGATIWANYVAGKLSPFEMQVVFSINPFQQASYSQYIPHQNLIVDHSDVQGPLKGLLTVHQKFPQQHLLLLACDMLDIDGETIGHIITTYNSEPGYDFYVYQDDAFAQPFCGIYTANGLATLQCKAASHQLEKYSMQYVLNAGHTKRLPVPNKAAFRNYNEPVFI